MSTYIYLVCTDHDPPIVAEDESGQHLYDLPQIRQDVADREHIVQATRGGFTADDYYRRNTARFLRQHPKCNLEIRDEYDRPHPLKDPDA